MSMRDVIRTSGWGPSRGVVRRMGPWQQQDEIDDSTVVNNKVSGDKVNFNQEVNQFADVLKRLAIKNKFKGDIVNTNQKVKEYNRRPKLFRAAENARKAGPEERQTKRSEQRSDLADDVLDDLAEALRRVAITNNFQGNVVNSAQSVKEYHHDDDLNAVAIALRRLGFLNNIAVN